MGEGKGVMVGEERVVMEGEEKEDMGVEEEVEGVMMKVSGMIMVLWVDLVEGMGQEEGVEGGTRRGEGEGGEGGMRRVGGGGEGDGVGRRGVEGEGGVGEVGVMTMVVVGEEEEGMKVVEGG